MGAGWAVSLSFTPTEPTTQQSRRPSVVGEMGALGRSPADASHMLECEKTSTRRTWTAAYTPVASRVPFERMEVFASTRAVWFFMIVCISAITVCFRITADFPEFVMCSHFF
jgi:hypothetical protein